MVTLECRFVFWNRFQISSYHNIWGGRDLFCLVTSDEETFLLTVSGSFFGTQWHEMHPQYWTKYQVWEWLQHLLDTNQLDASCIPFQEFDINGEHLCNMSLQDFTRAAGTAGQLLYSNIQHLKWNGKCLLIYKELWTGCTIV